MNNNPTFEQLTGLMFKIHEVIDSLKSIETDANQKAAFNMAELEVHTSDHECGTVHCVAGWYAIANQDNPLISRAMEYRRCSYKHGAALMAFNLGFVDHLHLNEFMFNHPEIWGNQYGDEIFLNSRAYNGLTAKSTKPMTVIINHWRQVIENIKALQANRLATSAIDSR